MSYPSPPTELSGIITLIYPLIAGMPRFIAAFLVFPLFAKAVVPRQIRVTFLIVLVAFSYPALAKDFTNLDWEFGRWMGFVLKEVLLGALVGYAMSTILWVMTAVGELIDVQAGFTNAQIFDPFGGHSSGPMSVFMSQLGVLFFIGFGGLNIFIQILYESYALWPPISFTPNFSAAVKDFAIETSATFLETAVKLALPVIGALLLVELGIGLVNRAAPQLNAFYFSMSIKAVSAMLVLSLMMAHLIDVFRIQLGSLENILPRMDRIWTTIPG